MKKHPLLIVTIVFAYLFSSCSKSNSSPSAYLKLKINGTWVTYNYALSELGPDLSNPAKTDLAVSANNKSQTEVFGISIQSDNQITTGTYASDDLRYFIVVDYMTTTNNDLRDWSNDDVSNKPPSKYTITITSITDKEIKGTFTGNYVSEFITEDVKEITEGEFSAPRIR